MIIQDWAKTGEVEDLGLEWHVPSQGEIDFVQQVLETVLLPELDILKNLSQTNTLPR